MGVKNACQHGMRSTFRDWCGDCTSFPREIAEAALAHKVGGDVERAYRRSDALNRRRELMAAWDTFCASSGGEKRPRGASATPLKRVTGKRGRHLAPSYVAERFGQAR